MKNIKFKIGELVEQTTGLGPNEHPLCRVLHIDEYGRVLHKHLNSSRMNGSDVISHFKRISRLKAELLK